MQCRGGPLVLKLGGELLDEAATLDRVARAVARTARRGPLVVVHGGGREIDLDLKVRGLMPRAVDGLRVTDAATLDVVLGVLAGRLNTRLVAALVARGVRAVGLTGADAAAVRAQRAGRYRAADGRVTDLGLVGRPTNGSAGLLRTLCREGYVPVVASIGLGPGGELLNVNADTLAAFLAARLRASRLVLAGATAGVLDPAGRTIPRVEVGEIDRLARTGLINRGMIAKLHACREALAAGVPEVAIVDGRALARLDHLRGTCVVANDPPRPALPAAGAHRARHRSAVRSARLGRSGQPSRARARSRGSR